LEAGVQSIFWQITWKTTMTNFTNLKSCIKHKFW
jgi:hypothetical protein